MKYTYALLYGSICAVISLFFGLVFGVGILLILFRMILFFVLATIVSYTVLILLSNIFPEWLQRDEQSVIAQRFGKILRRKNSKTDNTEISDNNIYPDTIDERTHIGKNFDVVLSDDDEDPAVSNGDGDFEAFSSTLQREQSQENNKNMYNRGTTERDFSENPIRSVLHEKGASVHADEDNVRIRKEINKNRRRLEENPQKFADALSSLMKS